MNITIARDNVRVSKHGQTATQVRASTAGRIVREVHVPLEWLKPSAGRLAVLCLLAGIMVEALVALRLWVQIMDKNAGHGLVGLGFRLSNPLVAPFAGADRVTPIKSTGILDFSTLVAMEFYLVATLVALFLLLVGTQVRVIVQRRLPDGAGHTAATTADDLIEVAGAMPVRTQEVRA